MKIANLYSHLFGDEYLCYKKGQLYQEIKNAIKSIDANEFVKPSNDATKKGKKLYDQPAINREFEKKLFPLGWKSLVVNYYVTGDLDVEKQIVKINDATEQKNAIEATGNEALQTNNQVDFVKDRIAVEVQFGKYFSVAYDLHVKHTFFYLRDDIDVGIEIIPTKNFERRLDTGVSWFENEVANVIREGRNNPTVPIVIIGIEPDELFDETYFFPEVENEYKKCIAEGKEWIDPYNDENSQESKQLAQYFKEKKAEAKRLKAEAKAAEKAEKERLKAEVKRLKVEAKAAEKAEKERIKAEAKVNKKATNEQKTKE